MIKGDGLRAREAGMKAAAEGRFVEAVPLLQKAVQTHPKRTDTERLSAAEAENALGGAFKALSRLEEATAAFQRAVGILDGLGATGARDLAVVVNNLGSVRADAGRVQEAEELYHRALRITTATNSGRASSSTAARTADDDNDDDDESSPGGSSGQSDSLISADAYNNLADLRHGAGRLDEARHLHERAGRTGAGARGRARRTRRLAQ